MARPGRPKEQTPTSEMPVAVSLAPFVQQIANYHRTLQSSFAEYGDRLATEQGRAAFLRLLRLLRTGALEKLGEYRIHPGPSSFEFKESELREQTRDGRDEIQIAVSLHLFDLANSSLLLVERNSATLRLCRDHPELFLSAWRKQLAGKTTIPDEAAADVMARVAAMDPDAETMRAVHSILTDEKLVDGLSFLEARWEQLLFSPAFQTHFDGKRWQLLRAVILGGIIFKRTSLRANRRLRGALTTTHCSAYKQLLDEAPIAALQAQAELKPNMAGQSFVKKIVDRARVIVLVSADLPLSGPENPQVPGPSP